MLSDLILCSCVGVNEVRFSPPHHEGGMINVSVRAVWMQAIETNSANLIGWNLLEVYMTSSQGGRKS